MPAPSSSLYRSSGRHISCFRETQAGVLELRMMPLWGQYCIQVIFSIAFLGVFRLGITMLPHIVGFIALGMGIVGVWMSWKGVNYKGPEFDSKRAIATIRPLHSTQTITLSFAQLKTIEVSQSRSQYDVFLHANGQRYLLLSNWPYGKVEQFTTRLVEKSRCSLLNPYQNQNQR